MENIRNFFNEIEDNAIDKIELVKSGKYRAIASKAERVTYYRDKITEKLFSLNEDDRKIYARLLIKEINTNNPIDRMVEKEVTIDDYEYLLMGIINEQGKNELVDISVLLDDCKLFISIIFELFLDFKIDIRDTVKELQDLEYELFDDYNMYVFLSEDIIAMHKRRNDENKKLYKKGAEYTAERQILAIETMLSELGVIVRKEGRYSKGEFDKITFASFLQFITGREADSLPKNTRFYKMINKEERSDRKNYNDDCDYVAKYFERLGLDRLAEKIRNGKIS